ncbi:serine/threonine protein kinase [Cohnella sp. CIP 111063]|uniref:serine/threonine protein kinase n=1 Tax=unclassified Cohnella TaxID=2636738 RepID=UPI000B8C06E2|nr:MULTISPECIES: serine/threonine protein kinase [unclassified Cohnella]OXS52934.1 serine/threonine protein kinase [Cohnella sp. CIP 111063]PRX60187.1 serine/threonine protein kinase [Cohnella sp. SGD-V74]
MLTKRIDGIVFELKEDFVFDFLSDYGQVFAVFDKQDSGYIGFGVQNGSEKFFLKVAGASTINSNINVDAAIQRLKSTVSIYEDLRHPNLIEIIEHKEIKEGYLTVFEWFEGECMGKQYGAFDKFIALPLIVKLKIYNDILLFHLHTNQRGYIAIDFYDGCIMHNFASKRTMICDIEFYSKKPVINTLGRMWGSSRYMSPEEFQLGAEIDERSNVFLMGATAFQLFGGGNDRSFEKWRAGEKLYYTALKAVNSERSERYQTVDEYFEAWNDARS